MKNRACRYVLLFKAIRFSITNRGSYIFYFYLLFNEHLFLLRLGHGLI